MNGENAANIHKPVSPATADKDVKQPQQKMEQTDMFQPAMQQRGFYQTFSPRKECYSHQHHRQVYFSLPKCSK